MVRPHNYLKFLGIISIFFLISAANAAPNTTWGVDIGDTAVYWIDDVRFSPTGDTNLAVLLGDNNRTNLVFIKAKGGASLNYTLGLQNGTNFLDNQQVRIDKISVQSQSVYIPNGSLPIVLPISVTDGEVSHNNYLQYLASVASVSDSLIEGLLAGANVTDLQVDPLYRTDLFSISFSGVVSDLEALSSTFLPDLNTTGQIGLGENQTINNIDIDSLISYNSTDGMMMEFDLDAAINSTQTLNDGTNTTNIMTFNTTMIRQSFTPNPLNDGELSDASSAIEENPFIMIGMIPAFFLLRKIRD